MRRLPPSTARVHAETALAHTRLVFFAGWMLAAIVALSAAAQF